MKTVSAALAFVFAQGANAAFSHNGFAPTQVTALSAVAKSEEMSKTLEDTFKYETSVNAEQKFKVKDVDAAVLDSKKRVQVGRYNDREMSVSVPFLKRPSKLDGTHAGDVGFDPLGLSEKLDLYTMMEAETRHARLAMLAVVGWPLSELLGPNFMLHGPNNLAPSVLNGFDPLSFITVAGIFGGIGFFEYQSSLRRVDDKPLGIKHKEDMANVWKYGVPGDYNFDPLNLYSMFGDSADGRKAMRELEISHGRWAMGGITAFAAWEALTGHAIVENSMFFQPNALLPVIGFAYLAFGFFYESKNTDQYLFQVEKTSEGEVRMERIQKDLSEATVNAAEATKDVRGIIGVGAEIAFDTGKDLKNKYDKMTNDYTADVMKNIK